MPDKLQKNQKKFLHYPDCINSDFLLTWRPARAERETAFALALPESLPALPPAYNEQKHTL